MTENTISAHGLVVRFGDRTVLDGIDLEIASGESVALLGRSGSGKTTVLNCILGLLRPSAGTVSVCGQNICEMKRRESARFRAEHLGVVFQHHELLLELTAAENVALPLMMARDGSGQQFAIEAAHTILDTLGVEPEASTLRLSGGERQRVALARAIVNQPDIILADEPTGSLDTELRDEAADMLFAAARERASTLVLVTHDPEMAARADRRIRIDQGRLTA